MQLSRHWFSKPFPYTKYINMYTALLPLHIVHDTNFPGIVVTNALICMLSYVCTLKGYWITEGYHSLRLYELLFIQQHSSVILS